MSLGAVFAWAVSCARRIHPAACLLLGGVLLAPSWTLAQTASGGPRLETRPCRVGGVKEDLRCGVYHVPEDRRHPRGRMLPLRVVIVPARAPQPEKEPLFVFAGGPGEAATDGAGHIVNSWRRQNHDVVLVDQRGTGEGHRLDCIPESAAADPQVYLRDLFEDFGFWKACRDRLSRVADLSLYATPVAAQDYDEVRRALGYDKINIAGGSYGSRMAYVYLKMFGRHVRAAILTGVAPLEMRSPLYHPIGAQHAFEGMVADCMADPACKAAYPSIEADLQTVLDRLRREPARVRIINPAAVTPVDLTLTADAFAEAVRVQLYSLESARRLPMILRRAIAGDYTELVMEMVRGGPELYTGLHWGMALSANCTEDTRRITHADALKETAGAFVGPKIVLEKMAVCDIWPKSVLPADHFEPFEVRVPVLMMSGDRDPVTPPRFAEWAQRSLPNSAHVVIRAGHSFPRDPCLTSMFSAFLKTASVQSLDTSCVQRLEAPPFVLPKQAP